MDNTHLLGLISMTDGAGVTSYYLSDGLGSTAQLTDSAGAVTDTYAYDVFGAPRAVTGTTSNDFRYTGQQDDRNANRGLYYLRARAYDPALGRFLQQDPLPLINRYAYVGDNPVNFADPSGLFPCPGCGKLKRALNVVGSGAGVASSTAVDYLSDPENLANVAQTVGGFGMVISCGGQDAIVPVAAVCAGSIILYSSGSLAKVYLADSQYSKACHAVAAVAGAVPLEGVIGKAVAFTTGTAESLCEPPTAYASQPARGSKE
jgi:RHS repeat-associated protein